MRLAAGADGLFSSSAGKSRPCTHSSSDFKCRALDEIQTDDDEDEDSDESFHYPSTSPTSTARPASIRSHGAPDYFSRPSTSRSMSTDLTPQLSQAPEFRVPTHEAPQKVHNPRWTTPTPHQIQPTWERDETVPDCRSCKRRFTFLFRKVRAKHHNRRPKGSMLIYFSSM